MKYEFKLLLCIVGMAFVFRAGPVVFLECRSPGYHASHINEIEFYYDDVARSLLAGAGFVHSVDPRPETPYRFEPGTPFSFVPPLYAWWLYLVYSMFVPNVFAAKILQSLMDASVCLLLFLLGRRIFGNSVLALTAAGLYAVYPLAIVMNVTLYYQVPMNVTLSWMVLCLMGAWTVRNGIWSGALLGITSLAKPITLPLIVLVPAVRIAQTFIRKMSLQRTLKWSMAFVMLSIAVLTPWTVRNYLVFEEFVPVQKGGPEPFYQGSREEYIDLDVVTLRETYGDFGVERSRLFDAALQNHIDHLKDNPMDYARFMGKKFLLSWYNTEGKTKNRYVLLIQVPFLALAVAGFLMRPRFWLSEANWYVPAVILYVCAIQVAIFPLVRYSLVIMPLVMIPAASGLHALALKAREIIDARKVAQPRKQYGSP